MGIAVYLKVPEYVIYRLSLNLYLLILKNISNADTFQF